MSLRNLQRRVAKIEKAQRPKLSPFAALYGSFDAWVEKEVLPALECGALNAEFIVIVAALRGRKAGRTWEVSGANAG